MSVTVLDRVEPQVTAQPRSRTVHVPTLPGEPATADATVLLVEDDVYCRSGLRRQLVRAGFVVCEAENGLAALYLLHRRAVDVVATDLCMPALNGLALVDALASDHPRLPVVAYSGALLLDPTIRRRLRELNVPLLCKPFPPEALMAALHAVLARARPPMDGSCYGSTTVRDPAAMDDLEVKRVRLFDRLQPLVLLVEDDPSCRSGLARHLRRAGFEVCEAADGIEALGLLFRWRVDAIVTDLVMPKLGGMMLADLAQRVRPDVPIVAFTGAASIVDQRRRALGRRGIELLDKPFSDVELLAAIGRAVAASGRRL